MVFGEPDPRLAKRGEGKIVVEIRGVEAYDPTTGQIRSQSPDDIACGFIDIDYNAAPTSPTKRSRALRAEIDEAAWASLHSSASRPFESLATGKFSVKVIHRYGDEVLKVYHIK